MHSIFLSALAAAVAAQMLYEWRYPYEVATRGWRWGLRGMYLVSFYILALLMIGLVRSYV